MNEPPGNRSAPPTGAERGELVGSHADDTRPDPEAQAGDFRCSRCGQVQPAENAAGTDDERGRMQRSAFCRECEWAILKEGGDDGLDF